MKSTHAVVSSTLRGRQSEELGELSRELLGYATSTTSVSPSSRSCGCSIRWPRGRRTVTFARRATYDLERLDGDRSRRSCFRKAPRNRASARDL